MADVNDFERELENELHRILDPMTAGPIPFRRPVQPGGSMKRLLGGAGAAIAIKILTGVAVAAAATTLAVATTEVVVTGTANPTNWGQQVKKQVNACKTTAEQLGQHGIGECVSSFAQTHGDTVSDTAPKNDKADKANTDKTKTGVTGNGSPNPNANAKNKNGQGSDKKPTTATTGEPTDPAIIVHTSIPPQP